MQRSFMKCLIFISLFSILFNSCAKFSNQEPVDYSLLEDKKKYKYDVVHFITQSLIGCDVKDCNDLFVQDERSLNKKNVEKLKNDIKVELNKGANKPKILNVYVDIETLEKPANNFFSFLSGLTFTVLPFKFQISHQISAVVLENNKVYKHYIHRADVDVWVQLLFVFAMPFQIRKEDKILNQLYDRVLEDLVKDNII